MIAIHSASEVMNLWRYTNLFIIIIITIAIIAMTLYSLNGQRLYTVCLRLLSDSRGCDLNPGPSAPESNTLTTRLDNFSYEFAHCRFYFYCEKMLFDNVNAYSFIPGLKPSFCANPSHCSAALPFFYLNIHSVDSPDCLLLFLFLVFFFCFYTF